MHRYVQLAPGFRVGRGRPGLKLALIALGCGSLAPGGQGCAVPPSAAADAAPSRPENPPADGFNLAGSDRKAVAIADAAMAAMGGRAAWDQSRYLVWRFFGNRLHIWDRFSGRERMESSDRKTGSRQVILMNLQTGQGQAFVDGREVTDAAQRSAALQHELKAWINDSYWLLMPYKLKDSGVTLRYKAIGSMADGRPADILVLTFAGVGVTPQNKYDVYVAKDSGLVEQWAYYEKAGDPSPEFLTPWLGWRRYGRILLSGDRGTAGSLTDLAVLDAVPDSVFTMSAPVDLKQLVGVHAAAAN